jgi:hypothetical protein
MAGWRVLYSHHARQRMLDWDLTTADVEAVLDEGETIENYDDNSRLVLGHSGVRPLHVVVADRDEDQTRLIITTYEPHPDRWDPGFRERRQP